MGSVLQAGVLQRDVTFFSLSVFNKAGFQTVPATLDPAETSEEVYYAFVKSSGGFSLTKLLCKIQVLLL